MCFGARVVSEDLEPKAGKEPDCQVRWGREGGAAGQEAVAGVVMHGEVCSMRVT